MTVVPLATAHVDEVARLHCESLNGLLSALGARATRLFYSGCVGNPSAIGYVYVDGGSVRGFVLGAARPAALKREVLRARPFGLLLAIASGAIRRPRSLLWLLGSLRGREGSYDQHAAELTYLAVMRDERRAGVGRRLVDAFTEAIARAGVSSYELSVDDDNQAAIGFYEQLGFRLSGRYREFGADHRRYRFELSAR